MLPETGKLVRDKIPDIIEAAGGSPHVVVLEEVDMWDALSAKLAEEVEELCKASVEQRVEEMADVFEVLMSIAGVAGFSLGEVMEAASEKRGARGGFTKRLWLMPPAT